MRFCRCGDAFLKCSSPIFPFCSVIIEGPRNCPHFIPSPDPVRSVRHCCWATVSWAMASHCCDPCVFFASKRGCQSGDRQLDEGDSEKPDSGETPDLPREGMGFLTILIIPNGVVCGQWSLYILYLVMLCSLKFKLIWFG